MDLQFYENNCKAFSAGMTTAERMDYYTNWAKGGKYEKDLTKGGTYSGPVVSGEAISRLFPDEKNIRILDIAAGTGYVGEELKNKGYHNVDALEPSEGMLQQAKHKNIYKNHFYDFFGGTAVHINDDEYDCTVVSGGMGEGHIPCSGLNEMIRIVKPGGVVCIVMKEDNLFTVPEYQDRLEPLMKQLEDDGKWKAIDRSILPNYISVGPLLLARLYDLECLLSVDLSIRPRVSEDNLTPRASEDFLPETMFVLSYIAIPAVRDITIET